MKRFTFAFVPAILLAMSVILIGTTAAGQSRIAEDQTAELKSLQKERIATLTQMVELLSHQIQSGAVANFSQLFMAQMELCDAKLDATDNLDERIALLEDQLKTAGSVQKQAETAFAAGGTTQADVLSAKSHYLRIKIRLVRERSKLTAKAR
jgi:CHAD domain-containing protein